MIVLVLGSAAGGGVPQWNCGCGNCVRTRLGEIPARTQSSIAVSPDGETWLLVNASVDVGRQLLATPEMWVTDGRRLPFAAILLTDANVDHTAGLSELRAQRDGIIVVSTGVVRSLLVSQRAYSTLANPPHRWSFFDAADEDDLAPFISQHIASAFDIRAVEVPGLLPGYAGRAATAGAVVAYVFSERRSGKRLLVAPVFADFQDRLTEIAQQCDAVFVDGTFFLNNELQTQAGIGKSARRLGHAPINGEGGTLARISSMKNRRIFVHINNTNPILDPRTPQAAAVAAAGCEVAYDGMRISID